MVQVLFVQGAGANVHDGWDHELVESLERELGSTYHVRYPRMPKEDDPSYARWKPALRREFESLDDGAILVGHSVGGTMLIHVIAEHPIELEPGALVLIASPFIGSGGWPSDEIDPRTEFGISPAVPVVLFHGSEDKTVPPEHAQLYARAIPHAIVHVLPHRDHQLNNDLGGVARAIRSLGDARKSHSECA